MEPHDSFESLLRECHSPSACLFSRSSQSSDSRPSRSPGRELAYFQRPTSAVEKSPKEAAPRATKPTELECDAAHELSNLLTAITLYATYGLERVAATDPLHQDLKLILAASERAAELSQRLQASDRSVAG